MLTFPHSLQKMCVPLLPHYRNEQDISSSGSFEAQSHCKMSMSQVSWWPPHMSTCIDGITPYIGSSEKTLSFWNRQDRHKKAQVEQKIFLFYFFQFLAEALRVYCIPKVTAQAGTTSLKRRKQNPKLPLLQRLLSCLWPSHSMERVPLHVLYQCRVSSHGDRAKPNQGLHSKVHMCCFCCCFSVSS